MNVIRQIAKETLLNNKNTVIFGLFNSGSFRGTRQDEENIILVAKESQKR